MRYDGVERKGTSVTSYNTIEGRARAEIVEKKSRFIATISHVETEGEALAFLEEIRAEHRMARHNVYAYVLREGGRVRYSDDGEPQKTAGMPTLEAVQHAGLTDVAVVVTRYFGGILLGTGGLVRAYTQATQAGIAAAHVVTVSRCVDVMVEVPYSLYEQACRLGASSGANLIESDFAAEVALTFRLLDGTQEPFKAALVELTRGGCPIVEGDPVDAPFSCPAQSATQE